MNFESFFAEMSKSRTVVKMDAVVSESDRLLNNEALFQLPLISLIVLMLAKDRRKLRISETGQLVGECIEASMPGFKGSAQHIGWSANLRVRTVKAISFLEIANLILVNDRKGRIEVTELGKRVITRALDREDDLAFGLLAVARAYRNICVSRTISLELDFQ